MRWLILLPPKFQADARMRERFCLPPFPFVILALWVGMPSPEFHPRDPLHGITLERLLTQLVEKHGWEEMGRRIRIRCFEFDPSIKSSLTFLRKTPWARQKVEAWYIAEFAKR
jgi:hypothetical protein